VQDIHAKTWNLASFQDDIIWRETLWWGIYWRGYR